ncbi:hypothetical protein CF319_g6455 [Tilletia indica]|nr:hypothetical protein CF319_g6455 [Tilletia indica]
MTEEHTANELESFGPLRLKRAAAVKEQARQTCDANANRTRVLEDVKTALLKIDQKPCDAMGQAIVSSYILPYFVDTNTASSKVHRKGLLNEHGQQSSDDPFHGRLLACFGPYPGAAIMYVTSAWQLAWASDSVVADATEHELDVAEDVWAQLLRDFHGVEVVLTSFAVNVASTKSLKAGGWRLNPENIAAMISAQGVLCMEDCGRALLFSADQRRGKSKSEMSRFIGVKQYYARGSVWRVSAIHFPSHDCPFRILCGTYHPWMIVWPITFKCFLVHRMHRATESKQRIRFREHAYRLHAEGATLDDIDNVDLEEILENSAKTSSDRSVPGLSAPQAPATDAPGLLVRRAQKGLYELIVPASESDDEYDPDTTLIARPPPPPVPESSARPKKQRP